MEATVWVVGPFELVGCASLLIQRDPQTCAFVLMSLETPCLWQHRVGLGEVCKGNPCEPRDSRGMFDSGVGLKIREPSTCCSFRVLSLEPQKLHMFTIPPAFKREEAETLLASITLVPSPLNNFFSPKPRAGHIGALFGCFGRKIDGTGLPGGLIIYQGS